MVNNLQVAFEKATKKYFESNSSDDERNAEYPDLKTNVFREKNFNAKNVVTPKPALLNELAATKLKDAIHQKPTTVSVTPIVADTSTKSSEKTIKSNKKESPPVHVDPDAVASNNSSSRGTKRKRKDKDKRKKKKSKSNSGRVTEDDEEESVVPVVPVPIRMPTDDEDEDAWEYDKPPKHIKKKKKNAVSSKKGALAKSKSKGHKDKKSEPESVMEKESPSKRKQKINKKKEYSSEEEQLEEIEEDEDRENRKRNVLSKNELKPSSKSPRKQSVDKMIESLSKKDRRNSTGSQKHKSAIIDRKPNMAPMVATSDPDELSLSSDDALFNFPMATSSTEKAPSNNKPKSKAPTKSKRNSESTKSKGKMESKNKERKNDDRERSRSPMLIQHRSPTPSSTSSRSNSPAVFTVDLHKKYSQSASTRTLHSPTKSKPAPNDLMSVSSGSRNSSPSPSNASSRITSKVYPTNHERKSAQPVPQQQQPLASSPPLLSRSPVTPSTPEIRNKYDLIKERRSRNNETAAEKVKSAKDTVDKRNDSLHTSNTTTLPKSFSAVTSSVPALSETIEKLKAKNKSTKQRSAMLSEILGGKKQSEVRTEKEIWEQLNTDATVKPSETKKKKKESLKKEKPSTTLMPPPVDEYQFVDDTPIDPPTVVTPITNPKEAPPVKLTKSGAVRKPRASKNAVVPAILPTPSVPKPTNLEALELETEQTLKDINRWLEHTPRFSDFNSASNSPSRYNLLDDFEAVTANLEAEFQRPIVEPPTLPPVKVTPIDVVISAADPIASESSLLIVVPPIVPEIVSTPATSPTIDSVTPLPKVTSVTQAVSSSTLLIVPTVPTVHKTTQLIGMMPAPGTQKREVKEKKKSLKDKIAGNTSKRKDLSASSASSSQKDTSSAASLHHHRGGIDRLQPGKTKGNLMKTDDSDIASSSTNTAPTSLVSSVANKLKEIKNSLMQPESETGPKLSLGSVLNTAGFGLGMQHNFGDDDEVKSASEKGECNFNTIRKK